MSERKNLTLTDSASHELNWIAKVTRRSEASVVCEAIERLAADVRDTITAEDLWKAETGETMVLLTRSIYPVIA